MGCHNLSAFGHRARSESIQNDVRQRLATRRRLNGALPTHSALRKVQGEIVPGIPPSTGSSFGRNTEEKCMQRGAQAVTECTQIVSTQKFEIQDLAHFIPLTSLPAAVYQHLACHISFQVPIEESAQLWHHAGKRNYLDRNRAF